jgi:hypothetical protein
MSMYTGQWGINQSGTIIDPNASIVSIEKPDGAIPNGQDDLFVIIGGPIMVIDFVGIVTTVIGGAANCHIDETVGVPAADIPLSTNVALGLTLGTSITFSGAFPSVLLPIAAGAIGAIPQQGWVCPIGTIKSHTSALQTGNIKWYMKYMPLSPNSIVMVAS